MTQIETYVFFDLETTGLPKNESNQTGLTELSMVAVKRKHLLETEAGAVPRVIHKLTLCLNPQRTVSKPAADLSGLNNDVLENEPVLEKKVFTMIDTFINVLTQPVCLIAHNGLSFDFPIFKHHMERLDVNFTDEVFCSDTYFAFYDILEKQKLAEVESKPKKQKLETDPEGTRRPRNLRLDRFPWGSWAQRPSESYKLKDVYERVLNKQAAGAHRAEADCVFMLEISASLAEQFVQWIDEHHINFSEVVPM